MLLSDRLKLGDFLTLKGRLFSPNGELFLVAQTDGNVVLYRTRDGASLWSTGNLGIARFGMQRDGNIVGTDAQGGVRWASNTDGHPGASLVLQDDGNMVASDSNGAFWDSGTNGFTGTRSGNQRGALTQAYDAGSDAVDEVKAEIAKLPGIEWAAGLVQDFAKTDVGKAFLRFASPVVLPILSVDPFTAPILFGVVAGVAFALPGLARGEPLVTAYANELRAAAKQVGQDILKNELPDAIAEAEVEAREFGKLAGEFPKDVEKTIEGMASQYGIAPPVDISALTKAYAAKWGIREDLARVTLDQVLGLDPYTDDDGTNPLSGHFNSETGDEKVHKDLHLAELSQLFRPKKSTATIALLRNGVLRNVSDEKAATAASVAHDVLLGRDKTDGFASYIARGKNLDAKVMQAALDIQARLQTRRMFVDRYTRGTK